MFGLYARLFKRAHSVVRFQRKQQLCCPHPPQYPALTGAPRAVQNRTYLLSTVLDSEESWLPSSSQLEVSRLPYLKSDMGV